MDNIDVFSGNRGILVEAHIADIHFGAFDPRVQIEILEQQFINEIDKLDKLDIVSIDGDLFDKREMTNSVTTMVAVMFIDKLVNRIIRPKGATLMIIEGTYSHDSNQYKIFYPYIMDKTIDVRIINTVRFENVKGARILCLPHLSGVPTEIYENHLFRSGAYDTAFMHGTVDGSVYGNNVGNSRLFTEADFINCLGPILAGHVHTGGCFFHNFYYCGSPYVWKYGEEEQKGFLIVVHNLDTHAHLVVKNPIYSFKYITINLDSIVSEDPRKIVEYIDRIKREENIDKIRIEFKKEVPVATKSVLNNYYKNTKDTSFKYDYTVDKRLTEAAMKYDSNSDKYNYLFATNLSEYDKLAKYINDDMGYLYTTGDDIKALFERETKLL